MNGLARRTWFTLAIAVVALAVGLAIAGAAVPGTSPGLGATPEAAKLSPFGSCGKLRGYLRRHRDALGTGPLTGLPIAEDAAGAAPAAGAEAGSAAPASSTNVQEAGVDEPDLVKVAGSTIFALAGDRLRAVSTAGAVPAVLDSIELPGGPGASYGDQRELLLAGDRALVITGTYGGPARGYAPRTLLTELDVSDPGAIAELATTSVDGGYLSARLTADTARVAIGAQPELPPAGRGQGRAWLPSAVTRDAAGASRRNLVGCTDVRRTRRFSGSTMLSVLTIDLERGLPAIDTDAVMTGGETVYASPTSLYVATERWHGPGVAGELGSSVSTAIHRFDTSDPRRTEYEGSGSVPGYMLSQWSMSEHEGVLRVASTSSPPWGPEGEVAESESYVTALVPSDGGLAEVGQLDGIGRGERIYAVRFIGSSGYVVTFRQVDPLHVVDLSDPAEPRMAGELEIPGYSAYLHPVAPGLLLGIGQDAGADGITRGAQASLFDVSDPANPIRTAHVSLGRNSSTEVEYDHHAFTWDAGHGLAVVPVSSWTGLGFNGAVGIRAGAAGLELTGRTAHGSARGGGDPPRDRDRRPALHGLRPRGRRPRPVDARAARAHLLLRRLSSASSRSRSVRRRAAARSPIPSSVPRVIAPTPKRSRSSSTARSRPSRARSSNGSSSCSPGRPRSRLVIVSPIRVRPRRRITGIASATIARAVVSTALVAAVAVGIVRARLGPGVVAEAQPHGDRAADARRGPHPPGDPVGERDDHRVERLGRARPAPERRLRAERAPAAARAHPPRVAVAGDRVQVAAGGAADDRRQRRLAQLGELADRLDPRAPELAGGRIADPPERLDRQRVQELALARGRDQQQPVGLRRPARHLRQRLRPRDPHGHREADPLARPAPQGGGDLRGRARDPLEPADVEEGLLERQPLDHRRGLGEELEQLLAGAHVGREPGRDDDRVGAEAAGAGAVHRPADPAAPSLVAGGHHDPAADDHRAAAEARIVALLDRGEEGVGVRVQDRRLVRAHEHTFARPSPRRNPPGPTF